MSTDSSSVLAASMADRDRALRKFRTAEYPKQVWYFLASFIFFVSIANLVSVTSGLQRRRRVVRADAEGEPALTGTISYRRLHLAAINAWRIVAFRCTVDLGKGYTINFAELFMTVTYISVLLVWSLINNTTVTGHRFDPLYYANRAGNIATVQLPLIVALSMKNNPIAFITGISYQKLGYLHRMCSRTIIILIWLHAAGRVQVGLKGQSAVSNDHIRAGILSAVALSLLIVVSVRPARQHAYEFFLLAHFVLVMITLLGTFVHNKHYGEDYYVWPSFLLWGLDRAIRSIRLVIFNHSYFGFKSGLGTFNATAEPITPGFVRLRFRRPNHLHWCPGKSAYLILPGVSTVPFESHPFTIANTDLNHDEAQDLIEKDSKKRDSMSTIPASHGKDIVFVVKEREGFTKRLSAIANGEGSLKVFVDGPYGAPPRLSGYDTTVFIAGGSGVAFTSPLFVDLLHRAHVDSFACRNFVFVWAVRDPSHVNLVYDDLLDSLRLELPGCNIDVRIYITSPDVYSIASSETSSVRTGIEGNERSAFKISRLPYTRIENGRPDVQSIIEEASSLAHGDMAVAVCGPAALTADVRKALRSSTAGPTSVLRGGPSIYLFVESLNI